MHAERRQLLKTGGSALLLALLAPFGGIPTVHALVRIDYAERPVREFLKMHFASSRAFTARGMDDKERFLTRRFRTRLYKYFQNAAKAENALPMVADPFTGSMNARDYSIGKAKVRSEKAWVPVTFTEGGNQWITTYLLRNDQERNDERWRIDDIQDVRGMLLTDALKKLLTK